MGLLRKGMGRRQLEREGARADAEVIDAEFTGTITNHGREYAVKLAVHPSDGPVFELDGKLNVHAKYAYPSGGSTIPIRYDPEYPTSLIYDEEEADRRHAQSVEARRSAAFDGTSVGGIQVVNASGAEPAQVVEKLERVRDQGLISQQQFDAAKAQVESGGATPPAPPASGDVAERLKRLDLLRAQGVLTEEEYSAQRKRILDTI